ncbi:Putative cell wall binding repeat-containing protein [Oribacterium sp. KHPX15]|uniref:hypothetical protein n=1 Tax=unclassified Oribacterium TaxID=2629782 RepID=UPI0004E10EFE|nr:MULTISPECIES: hypothetical protein [unclassified Oribacterium]SDZ97788.1 Putative cell wall binding repeat-containing protein [Oribacterium sp. KHPX15]
MNTKYALAALAAASMIATVSVPAYADDRTAISSVTINVATDLSIGSTSSDVEVTTNSSLYDVYSATITNTPSDGWDEDDNPKVQIKLALEDSDEYKWNITKSTVTVTGDDGTVTSVSGGSGHGYLTIVYTLKDLDEVYTNWSSSLDLDIDDADWQSGNGIADWTAAESAKKYEVKLYRGSSLLTTVTTTNTYYSFANYFTSAGTYSYKVRAIYTSSYKGDWEESDDIYVTETEASYISSSYNSSVNSTTSSTSSSYVTGLTGSTVYGPTTLANTLANSTNGQWIQDQYGWWYRNPDGSWTSNGWQQINGKFYYFNSYGYMQTGWILWDYQYYYCGADGAMLTNTTTPDGYYVNSAGVWVSNYSPYSYTA